MNILAETIAGIYRVVTYEEKGQYTTTVRVGERVEEESKHQNLEEALQGHEDTAHKYIFLNKENEDFLDRW